MKKWGPRVCPSCLHMSVTQKIQCDWVQTCIPHLLHKSENQLLIFQKIWRQYIEMHCLYICCSFLLCSHEINSLMTQQEKCDGRIITFLTEVWGKYEGKITHSLLPSETLHIALKNENTVWKQKATYPTQMHPSEQTTQTKQTTSLISNVQDLRKHLGQLLTVTLRGNVPPASLSRKHQER